MRAGAPPAIIFMEEKIFGEIHFPQERYRKILELVEQNKFVTTAELQRQFGISYASAKRDLNVLAQKGLVKRTHGGAAAIDSLPTHTMISENDGERAVAEYAAGLICEGDTVFVSSCPIGKALLGAIPDGKSLRLVVNSVEMLNKAAARPNCSVVMLGGELDRFGCCNDSFAIAMLRRLRLDLAFVGTAGISSGFGLSAKSAAEAELVGAVIDSSRKKLGIYPQSALDRDSSFSVGAVGLLDCIITDGEVGRELTESCIRGGVKICTPLKISSD